LYSVPSRIPRSSISKHFEHCYFFSIRFYFLFLVHDRKRPHASPPNSFSFSIFHPYFPVFRTISFPPFLRTFHTSMRRELALLKIVITLDELVQPAEENCERSRGEFEALCFAETALRGRKSIAREVLQSSRRRIWVVRGRRGLRIIRDWDGVLELGFAAGGANAGRRTRVKVRARVKAHTRVKVHARVKVRKLLS
jgi:hypothetical protein